MVNPLPKLTLGKTFWYLHAETAYSGTPTLRQRDTLDVVTWVKRIGTR